MAVALEAVGGCNSCQGVEKEQAYVYHGFRFVCAPATATHNINEFRMFIEQNTNLIKIRWLVMYFYAERLEVEEALLETQWLI
jgi:hypothetical protein